MLCRVAHDASTYAVFKTNVTDQLPLNSSRSSQGKFQSYHSANLLQLAPFAGKSSSNEQCYLQIKLVRVSRSEFRMMMRSKSAVSVSLMMMAITALLVASSSARPLGGNAAGRGESAAAAAVVVASGGESTIELLQGLYLQNLQVGPGASCSTNSNNVECATPPPRG